jgi:shikimate dehydrogenase
MNQYKPVRKPISARKPKIEVQHKVFCILGDERVFNSKSPEMFTRVLKQLGIKGSYIPFMVPPDQIGQAVKSLKTYNIVGANVTAPFKERVIPYLDALSEGANIVGAVNTITCHGDTLKGYNTNAIGFMDALEDAGFDAGGKSALVFGTGGVARAVVFMLNWLRAESIMVVGRNEDKIKDITGNIAGEGAKLEDLGTKPIHADIVVNATAVSNPEESAEMSALIGNINVPNCELVVDLNYGRDQNFWKILADSRGARFMDGLIPLAFQAVRSFTLFTGLRVESADFLNLLDPSYVAKTAKGQ